MKEKGRKERGDSWYDKELLFFFFFFWDNDTDSFFFFFDGNDTDSLTCRFGLQVANDVGMGLEMLDLEEKPRKVTKQTTTPHHLLLPVNYTDLFVHTLMVCTTWLFVYEKSI